MFVEEINSSSLFEGERFFLCVSAILHVIDLLAEILNL